MKTTDLILIENRLMGELSPDELAGFQKRLLSDPAFAREFYLRKEVEDALGQSDIIELRSILKDISDSKKPETKTISLSRRIIRYSAVASITLAIGIASVITWEFRPMENERIYDRFYQPYEQMASVRSGDNNVDQILSRAMLEYQSANYNRAIFYFTQVLENDQQNVIGNFYSGVSSIEIKKFSQAESSFNKVIEQKNNLFIEQSNWYLGFCYLMTDQKEKAIEKFSEISEQEGHYKKNAQKVLRHIK